MIETLNLLVALLAVFVSAVALIRTRRIGDRQLKLQERQVALEEDQARFERTIREANDVREDRDSRLLLAGQKSHRLVMPYEGHEVSFENQGGRATTLSLIAPPEKRIRLEPTDVLDSGRYGTLHFEHRIDSPLDYERRNPQELWDFSILYTDRNGKHRKESFQYSTETGRFVQEV